MAGRRQHFIPRMLLRRFSDAKEQVRVIHRKNGMFLAAVGNVALERDFFGEPGVGTVDDALTHAENHIDFLLKNACECIGAINAENAAHLIAHMTSRGRSIRNFMEQSGRVAVEELVIRSQDEEGIRNAVLHEIRKNPAAIIDEFHSSIQTQYGSAALKRFKREKNYESVLKTMLVAAEQRILTQDISELMESFQGVIQQLNSNLSVTVFTAHSRAMMNGVTPVERVRALSAFTYEVVENSQITLADCVAWGVQTDGSPVPLFQLKDDISAVFMPLSASQLLVGRKPGHGVELPTTDELHKITFQVSEAFVIGHPSLEYSQDFSLQFGEAITASIEKLERDLRGDAQHD